MADKYILSVTAGPTYKDQTHVAVNSEKPLHIDSPHLSANLVLRIQNYRGLPHDSPKTSPYFSQAPHEHDLYSVGFTFTPKTPINGHDLVFGNDFDHPIRDKLPPGFQQAFNLVKWFIDPGLYGDVHADEPYLYGPLLSSMNVLRVGAKDDRAQEAAEEVRANAAGGVLEEGGDGDGEAARKALGVPEDAAGRKKFYLDEAHQKAFTFEAGREYANDFFNPYLDFNDFALRLPKFGLIPGITIPILNYWDGQPLRYVLKNRATDSELLVIVFTLLPKDQEAGKTSAEKSAGAEKKEEAAPIHVGGKDDDLD